MTANHAHGTAVHLNECNILPGTPRRYVRRPESVGHVRRLIKAVLEQHGFQELADDFSVVVSELATNAVEHTDGVWFWVTVTFPDDVPVRVEVRDTSPVLPTRRDADVHGESGRGLQLVDELAHRTVFADPFGKTVSVTPRTGVAA